MTFHASVSLSLLAAGSSDESLREMLKRAGIVQLLKVGAIERTGRSETCPLALVLKLGSGTAACQKYG